MSSEARRLYIPHFVWNDKNMFSIPKYYIITIFFSLIQFIAFAQEPTDKEKKAAELKKELKSEVEFHEKRYRVYNNYLCFGVGPGYSTGSSKLIAVGKVDYNFHIQKHYFQLGASLSGLLYQGGRYTVSSAISNNDNTSFYIGYTKRKENKKSHLAASAGLSYSTFYLFRDSIYDIRVQKQVGIYLSVHYIYKIKYDVGVGFAPYVDLNTKRIIGGLAIELFFSGAYRGKVKK